MSAFRSALSATTLVQDLSRRQDRHYFAELRASPAFNNLHNTLDVLCTWTHDNQSRNPAIACLARDSRRLRKSIVQAAIDEKPTLLVVFGLAVASFPSYVFSVVLSYFLHGYLFAPRSGAYYVGIAIKSAGMLRWRTLNSRDVWQLFEHFFLPVLPIEVLYTFSLIPALRSFGETFEFAIFVAGVTFAVQLPFLYKHQIRIAYRERQLRASLKANPLSDADFNALQLEAIPSLVQAFDKLHQELTAKFKTSGSPTNHHASISRDALQLRRALEIIRGVPPTQATNPDRAAKAMLTFIGTSVAGLNIVTCLNDDVMLSDALLTLIMAFSVLAIGTFNPHETLPEARRRFEALAAPLLPAIAYWFLILAIYRINQIESIEPAAIYGLLLALTNLTIRDHIGPSVSTFLFWLGSQIGRLYRHLRAIVQLAWFLYSHQPVPLLPFFNCPVQHPPHAHAPAPPQKPDLFAEKHPATTTQTSASSVTLVETELDPEKFEPN